MACLWSMPPGMKLTAAGRQYLDGVKHLDLDNSSLLDPATGEARIKTALGAACTRFQSWSEAWLYCAVITLLTYAGRSRTYSIGEHEAAAEHEIGRIYPQHRIDHYTADILVDCHFKGVADPLRLVVECDGPWHEKARQFRLDRQRDRWMAARGYRVLRFASSEIMAREVETATDCAEEVHETILAHLRHEARLLPRRANFITCRMAAHIEELDQLRQKSTA